MLADPFPKSRALIAETMRKAMDELDAANRKVQSTLTANGYAKLEAIKTPRRSRRKARRS